MTGLDDEGVLRKREIVKRALQKHQEAIQSKDTRRILAAVGGAELVALIVTAFLVIKIYL